MKYTKYFGLITKEQGRLNLSTQQFQRMMNIVHIEGVVLGLNKAKETYKDTNQYLNKKCYLQTLRETLRLICYCERWLRIRVDT